MAIIEDNYIIGPKEEIFEACKGFAADLTDIGLKFQSGKLAFTLQNNFTLLNGSPTGVISSMGQSLMHMGM
jgi:hypothetical protein